MKVKRPIDMLDGENDKENIYPLPKYIRTFTNTLQENFSYGFQQQQPQQYHANVYREESDEVDQHKVENKVTTPIKLRISKQGDFWSVSTIGNDDANTSNSSLNSTTTSRYQLRLRTSLRTKSSNPILEPTKIAPKNSRTKKKPSRTVKTPKKAATTTAAVDLTQRRNKEDNFFNFIVRPSEYLNEAELNDMVNKARTSQTRVRLNRSSLRIALVEAHTNIVCSLAQLDLHLFKCKTAPCIYCSKCVLYMNVEQFGKHIHDDDDESGGLVDKKPGVKYNMLPCPDDLSGDLSPEQIELWNVFLARVSKFDVFSTQNKSQPPPPPPPQNSKLESQCAQRNEKSCPMEDRESITEQLVKRGFNSSDIIWMKLKQI